MSVLRDEDRIIKRQDVILVLVAVCLLSMAYVAKQERDHDRAEQTKIESAGKKIPRRI